MARRVIVEKPVSQGYNELRLPVAVGLILFNRLRADLPEEYDSCKLDRDEEDETCFRYRIEFALLDRWHVFSFRVNDTQSPDHLFVETIDYVTRPGS